jgi:hypothetical protein
VRIVSPFVSERGRAIGIAIKAPHPTGQGLFIDDVDCICRLLFTFVTPVTCRARSSALDFSSSVRTTPFSVTTLRLVSTSIREKFDALSAVNFP